MKLVVFALLALAVLGGGGAGAYFYFMNTAEAAATEGDVVAQEKKKEKPPVDHSKTAFVELDPLVLPVVDQDGVSEVVSLVVALEVTDEKAAEEVKHVKPRLKDAYIQALYGVLNKNSAIKNGVLQVGLIKSKLNSVSTEILGEEKFHGVLLQVVQQRPI